MWWMALGCSLPEPPPDPREEYDRRDGPFEDDGDSTADSGQEDSTADSDAEVPVDDSGETSGPDEPVVWSGDVSVQVSDATEEYATCEGQIELTVTGTEITGYGDCLLVSGPVPSGSRLDLTFFDGVESDDGEEPWGRVYAHWADDSFVTMWIGTWKDDTEMRGDFFVVASEELGHRYDGQFLLTREE